MPDEAVLRILVQEGFDPATEAWNKYQRSVAKSAVDYEYAKIAPFDPAKEAEDRLEKGRRRAAVEAEYAKLIPPEPPFDPAEEAKKKLEKKNQRDLVEAEYAKLLPPEPLEPPFDPEKEALKKIEREKKRAAVQEEYNKWLMTSPAAFDPVEEAKKRIEREKQRAAVDKEYEKLKPLDVEPVKGFFEDILGAAKSMRGTVGGRFGSLAGASLDMMSAGGGTAGASGMMGAAGPAGLAIAVAAEVDKLVKGVIKGTISTAGSIASVIASPSSNPADSIAALGEAASEAGDKFGMFSYALTAAGESLKVLSSIMNSLNKTAERYGEYSPQIAQAQAISEMRQMMGDFRRSQVISADMAKFVMTQSDLQQKFEDIKIKMLTRLIPMVTGILTTLEVLMASGESVTGAINTLADPLSKIASIVSELLGVEKDKNLPDVKDPTEQLGSGKFFDTPDKGGWAPDR